VYWLARMLEAGEDPLYVARRVTRFASEDVGLADPRALQIAVAAYQACHFIGMPECSVHLTQAVVYMALAPKSNALYMAYETAYQLEKKRETIKNTYIKDSREQRIKGMVLASVLPSCFIWLAGRLQVKKFLMTFRIDSPAPAGLMHRRTI
jgi:replication-associated recombination protein RarA